jgi:glucose-1-phosphate thymidylyltransferase
LGDNVFYGGGLVEVAAGIVLRPRKVGATVFGYHVNDPERFGVVDFDENMHAKSIVEKPEHPASELRCDGAVLLR